jgi:hypothetical protein
MILASPMTSNEPNDLDDLGELMDSLRLILEDSLFERPSASRLSGTALCYRFFKDGFRFHDDTLIYRNLEEIHSRAPYKLTGLFEVMGRRRLGKRKGLRDGNVWYLMATAPRLLPFLASLIGLLKFSAREAQWAIYSTVWIAQLIIVGALLSLISPQLVPALVVWAVGAELMHEQLDIEEALRCFCPVATLRTLSKMEYVLELCQERCIEIGKLIDVGERFVKEHPVRSRVERRQSCSLRINLQDR